MYVKVISKRKFRVRQIDKLAPLLKKLRSLAEKEKGFVSRSTYSSVKDPGECIVISEWKSADDWINWMNKKKTRTIQGEIDSLIGEKTFFEIYKPENY